MKQLIKQLLSKTPYEISKRSGLHEIREELDDARAALASLRYNLASLPHLYFLTEDAKGGHKLGMAELAKHSHSQLAQDLFACTRVSDQGSGRFFVEFGATNGIKLSNTYLLEQRLGWNGILAEPGRIWHDELTRNRTCRIDFRCVSSSSNQTVPFLEVQQHEHDQNLSPELSAVKDHAFIGDWASDYRKENSREYLVSTVSLNDLLHEHSAPRVIDYLSIDTEGSEYDILQAVDFDNYQFRTITVEHNFTSNRELIYKLLTSHGYRRVFEDLSQWDDWYTL